MKPLLAIIYDSFLQSSNIYVVGYDSVSGCHDMSGFTFTIMFVVVLSEPKQGKWFCPEYQKDKSKQTLYNY